MAKIFTGGVLEVPVRLVTKFSTSYLRLTSHTQNGEVSEILQAKLADGHSVGYICAVGDRWCSLCETRAPAFSPKVMLFDRVVFPVLNHVDFQASELGGLDKSNQFYGC